MQTYLCSVSDSLSRSDITFHMVLLQQHLIKSILPHFRHGLMFFINHMIWNKNKRHFCEYEERCGMLAQRFGKCSVFLGKMSFYKVELHHQSLLIFSEYFHPVYPNLKLECFKSEELSLCWLFLCYPSFLAWHPVKPFFFYHQITENVLYWSQGPLSDMFENHINVRFPYRNAFLGILWLGWFLKHVIPENCEIERAKPRQMM